MVPPELAPRSSVGFNAEPAPEWLVAERRSRVLAAEDASPELLKRVIEGADQLEAKRSVSQ